MVGGIAGDNYGTIENCWVSADMASSHHSGYDADLGGIAGWNESGATIQFCCMTGNVQNTGENSDVGGIAGSNDGTIEHCSFYGSVSVDHSQNSKYIGKQEHGTANDLHDTYDNNHYSSASGYGMYAYAYKFPYSVTVNTIGHGSIQTEAVGEYDVPGTRVGETFTLHVTSGSVARFTITNADGIDIPLQGQANDGSSYWFVMPQKNITATFVFYEDWPTQGTGTEADPYLISSADDWNKFAHNVTYGRSYSGQYVKLTNDISVSTSAGSCNAATDTDYKPFSGTFDGDGHTLTVNLSNQSRFGAPFKCVENATIKNLRTAGTIDGTGNVNGKLLSGLVGVSFGNTTITGCRSSVTLTTDFGWDAALAGLVAGTKGGSLTIEGCVFDGSMTGASNTRCAGIAGYEYAATTTSSNSLFIPATLTISTADDSYTKTISRDPDATITGCYYTQPLGAAQGTAAYFGNINVPNTLGDLVTDYGVVKAYANGLFFNGKYYYSDAGSWSDPYIIDSEDVFARIAPIVNSGVSDFVGKHFSLICDLDLSGRNWIPIGNTVNTSFKGNFDGNNHTISNLTVNNPSGDYNGLFGYVEGLIHDWENDPGCDYIRNFVVKNTNVRGRNHTGGVAGHVLGQLIFENVILDGATVEGADYTSGFIGFAEGIHFMFGNYDSYNPLNVQNCLFINGSVTANNAVHIYDSYDHPRSSFVMFGEISNHSFFTNCYFSNIVYNGAAAQEDYYNVQAYPVIVNAPSNINCEFLFAPIFAPGQAVRDCYVSSAGLDYNGNYYIPGTTPFRLSYNDYQYRVTSVKINGVEVGTNIGEYVLNAGCSPIDSYTVTVEYEPGFTGSGTEDDPYLITSTELWDWFAFTVSLGRNYSGKFVRLDADISVSKTVGLRDDKPFSGTFLGNGHTITANISSTTTGTDANEQGVAPFHYINGATIKDLTVAGTIASASYHTSGLVGFADGTNLIENCIVTATLNISNDYAGGLVGHGRTSTTTIRGCVFAGTINGVDGDRNNIGGIWGWSDSGTPTLEDCMEAGTYTHIASMHPMGLQKAAGTITNCYYVTPQIGEPGNACTVSGASQTYSITPGDYVTVANAGAVNNEYSVSGLTFYAAGFKYNDVIYAASDNAVSLNLSSSAPSAEYHASAGTLNGSENPYTLTMPGEDVVIGMHALQDIGTTVWYAIATPMHDDGQDYESISGVTNLTTDNYDLLRYDETTGTWESQKANGGATGFTTLEPGRGYIYRCSAPRTLTYTGVPNNEESYSVSLTASSAAGDLKGFNLVGNPYPFSVTMYRPFYSLGADGIWQAHASGESLEAGQGALVYATSDETLTFYAATRSTNPGTKGYMPPLPKGLCLNGNTQDSYSTHSTHFAHQDGNSIVVTGTGTLQAYDIMGRLLFRMEPPTANYQLPTTNFPRTGVYILRLGGKSQKIVIK